ncbi:MAG: Transcriptional regulator, TrmB [Candidatus Moranbacteria bacterium GW2011_GWF1_34_10]|nr:MAG: Transcriptional regulator, TrmB [Candidatus Moranbacteria bacterium GW2011_GWF1_34_10]
MQEKLKALGLSYNEQRVYMSLVKIGETSVGDIIKDVNAHRQSVYNALEELEEKGLVIKNKKNGTNHYKVSDPDEFLNNLKKKELIARQLGEEISKELSKNKHEHEINVFDGSEKIKHFFFNRDKKLPKGSELRIISNYANKYKEVLGDEFLSKEYNQLLIKKNLDIKIISSELFREEFTKLSAELGNIKNRRIKFLSNDLMSPMATEIWEDGISFSSFEKDWFVIEIKNVFFAKAYKAHFESFWKIAKK